MPAFVPPSEIHKRDVLAYAAEVRSHDGEFDGSAGLGSFDSYELWLERIRLLASSGAEKHGFYRTPVFLAYDENRLIGILSVRISSDDFVTSYAGHIGYHVRPSCRRMGYGKLLLFHADRLCRQYGIARPVVCTDPGNIASQKTALSCGYVFAGEVDFRGERRILRYLASE